MKYLAAALLLALTLSLLEPSAAVNCLAGESSPTGQPPCTTCAAGTWSWPASNVCSQCPAGTYSEAKSAFCTNCYAGKSSLNAGATSVANCTLCAAGQYQSIPGQALCEECLAGQYQGGVGSVLACTACEAGKASNVSGQTTASTCTACAAGKWSGESFATCADCAVGKASANASAIAESTCSPCGHGRAAAAGSTVCTDCGAGEKAEHPVATCTTCSEGYFAVALAAECDTCLAGTAATAGSESCTNCVAGYAATQASGNCAQCPAGKWSGNIAGECIECAAGKASAVTAAVSDDTCSVCPIGKAANAVSAATACIDCAFGHHATAESTACTACVIGKWYASNGEQASDCVDCAAGKSSSAGSATISACSNCPVGKYGVGGTACSNCAAGKSTEIAGLMAVEDCNDCSAGWTSQSGHECVACVAGTSAGATGPGQAGPCAQCAAGKFSTGSANSECVDCPPGAVSPAGSSTGASDCTLCVAGKSGAALNSCSDCQAGQFANLDGALSCTNCPAGHAGASAAISITDCVQCDPGQSAVLGGPCLLCAGGKHQATAGQQACTDCGAGSTMTTPSQGSISSADCVACNRGQYKEVAGATTACTICPAGRYSNNGDASSATSCTACAAGKFKAVREQYLESVCENCEAGKDTVGADAATSCSRCSNGHWSAVGAASCTGCSAGKFTKVWFPRTSEGVCSFCSAGRYKSDTGSYDCDDCAAGKYSTANGATSESTCIVCSSGKYRAYQASSYCDTSYSTTVNVVGAFYHGNDFGNKGYNSVGANLGCHAADHCSQIRNSIATGTTTFPSWATNAVDGDDNSGVTICGADCGFPSTYLGVDLGSSPESLSLISINWSADPSTVSDSYLVQGSSSSEGLINVAASAPVLLHGETDWIGGGHVVVDGDASTGWTFNADETLQVDLGSAKTLREVRLQWDATAFSSAYTVEGSNDASTWTELRTGSALPGLTKNAVSGSYRYVQIKSTAGPNGAAEADIKLMEFEVFEVGDWENLAVGPANSTGVQTHSIFGTHRYIRVWSARDAREASSGIMIYEVNIMANGFCAGYCCESSKGFLAGECVSCPAGKYGSQTECTECPSGHYTDTAGQPVCHRCPAGQFKSQSGASSCDNCTVASVDQAVTGASICETDCTSGTCCAPGTGLFPGHSDCVKCPPGHWGSQSVCQACAAGKFARYEKTRKEFMSQRGHASSSATSHMIGVHAMIPITTEAMCLACPSGQTSSAGHFSVGHIFGETSPTVARSHIQKTPSIPSDGLACNLCASGKYSAAVAGEPTLCQTCSYDNTNLALGKEVLAYNSDFETTNLAAGNATATSSQVVCPTGTFIYHLGSHCCNVNTDQHGNALTYESDGCGSSFVDCPAGAIDGNCVSGSYSASNVCDGDASTSWSSGTAAVAHVQVDLGTAPLQINLIQVTWGTASSLAYSLLGSNDGTTWAAIDPAGAAPQAGTISHAIKVPCSFRYIRVRSVQPMHTGTVSIYEVAIFGGNNIPAKVVDGSTEAYWSSSNSTSTVPYWSSSPEGEEAKWIEVDLSAEATSLSSINVNWGADYAPAYYIYGRTDSPFDGTSAQPGVETTIGFGAPTGAGVQVHDVSAVGAVRYIRVHATEPGPITILELEVIGKQQVEGASSCSSDCATTGTCCPGIYGLDVSPQPYTAFVSPWPHSTSTANRCIFCPQGRSGAQSLCLLCDAGKAGQGNIPCASCNPGNYAERGSGTCSGCEAGKYSDVSGATSLNNCKACPDGKMSADYSTTEGACTDCPSGYFSESPSRGVSHWSSSNLCQRCNGGKHSALATTVCSLCPAGKSHASHAESSASSCNTCGAGYYQSDAGGSTSGGTSSGGCGACGNGKYSDADATVCSLCPAGKFRNSHAGGGVGSCENCPAGKSSEDGQALCSDCLGGKYAASGGQTTPCGGCPAGKYGTATGSADTSNCLDCAPGKSTDSAGYTACALCTVGTYGGEGQATPCIGCAAGKVHALTGQQDDENCAECVPGSSTEGATGQSSCKACPAGQSQATAGQPTCTNCNAGKSTNGATGLSSACIDCSKGKHQASAGSSSCVACPAGEMTDNAAQTDSSGCWACDQGKYANPLAVSISDRCVLCPAGEYAVTAQTPVEPTNTTGFCPESGRFYNSGSGNRAEDLPYTTYTDAKLADASGNQPGDYPWVKHASDGLFHPICGHNFWDNDHGATAFCQLAGYSTGVKVKTEITFAVPAVRVGWCNAGDKLNACTGGENKWDVVSDWCPSGEGVGVKVMCVGDFVPLDVKLADASGNQPGDYPWVKHASDGLFHPLCGHNFWDNDHGATAFCQLAGYSTGVKVRTDITFAVPAVRVGMCNTGDKLNACTAGQNKWDVVSDWCPSGESVGVKVMCYGSNICDLSKSCPSNNALGAGGCSVCTPCAAGHFSSSLGNAIGCTACPSGKFSASLGAAAESDCEDCEAGKYGGGAVAVCTDCGVGKYKTLTAQTADNCDTCPANTGSELGASGLALCFADAGFTGTGADLSSCAAGTFKSTSLSASACTDCSAGKFKAADMQTTDTCENCPLGQYSNDGANACTNCSAGFYTGSVGTAVCTGCALGKYSTSVGSQADDCSDCVAGKETAEVGGSSIAACVPCSTGTYGLGGAACLGCAVGKVGPDTGMDEASDCVQCFSGTYAPSSGASACTDCAGGQYSGLGALACLGCSAGTSSWAASSTCTICEKGTFAEQELHACRLCASGMYGDSKGGTTSDSCSACPVGTFKNVEGQDALADCDVCEVGKFKDGVGASACDDCPANTYKASTGQDHVSDCNACPPNSVASAGSANHSECRADAGYTGQGSAVAACAAGKFKDETNSSDPCKNCPVNTFKASQAQLSISDCSSCPDNSGSSAGSGAHSNCLGNIGYRFSGEDVTACAPGTFKDIALSAASCKDCQAGSFMGEEAAYACTNCSAGTYNSLLAQSSNTCDPCPLNTMTAVSGATDVLQCLADAGYSGNTGDETLRACAPGTFKSLSASSAPCVACTSGKFKDLEEQTSDTCISCVAGKYQNETAQASDTCISCVAGKFKDQAAQATDTCISCVSGKYFFEDAQASDTCISCMAGNYASSTIAATSCISCVAGKYKDTAGAFVSAVLEQDPCISCVAGKFKDRAEQGTDSCISCVAGKFKDQAAQASDSCISCVAGKFKGQAAQASDTCIRCVAGKYQNETAQASDTCIRCVAGKYQNETAQASDTCISCVAGKFKGQAAQGMDSCISCVAGQYQGLTAQISNTSCTDCVTNFHSPKDGSPICAPCPYGSNTTGPGFAACRIPVVKINAKVNMYPFTVAEFDTIDNRRAFKDAVATSFSVDATQVVILSIIASTDSRRRRRLLAVDGVEVKFVLLNVRLVDRDSTVALLEESDQSVLEQNLVSEGMSTLQSLAVFGVESEEFVWGNQTAIDAVYVYPPAEPVVPNATNVTNASAAVVAFDPGLGIFLFIVLALCCFSAAAVVVKAMKKKTTAAFVQQAPDDSGNYFILSAFIANDEYGPAQLPRFDNQLKSAGLNGLNPRCVSRMFSDGVLDLLNEMAVFNSEASIMYTGLVSQSSVVAIGEGPAKDQALIALTHQYGYNYLVNDDRSQAYSLMSGKALDANNYGPAMQAQIHALLQTGEAKLCPGDAEKNNVSAAVYKQKCLPVDESYRLLLKGGTQEVLALCTKALQNGGDSFEIDDEDRVELQNKSDALSFHGLEIVALAYGNLTSLSDWDEEARALKQGCHAQLIFVGIIGVGDVDDPRWPKLFEGWYDPAPQPAPPMPEVPAKAEIIFESQPAPDMPTLDVEDDDASDEATGNVSSTSDDTPRSNRPAEVVKRYSGAQHYLEGNERRDARLQRHRTQREQDREEHDPIFSGQPNAFTITGAAIHEDVNTTYKMTKESVNQKPVWEAVGGADLAVFMGHSGYWIVTNKKKARRGEIQGWFIHTKLRAPTPKQLVGSVLWHEAGKGKSKDIHLVIIDSDSSMTRRASAADMVGAARDSFDEYDKDASGYLDREELTDLLFDCGIESDIDALFKEYDTNGDHKFSFEEFIAMYNKLVTEGKGGSNGQSAQPIVHNLAF